MHEKAVYLALAGFVLTRCDMASTISMTSKYGLRVKRQRHADEDYLKLDDGYADYADTWVYGLHASAEVDKYTVVTWNVLPDKVWDKLGNDLIQRLIDS